MIFVSMIISFALGLGLLISSFADSIKGKNGDKSSRRIHLMAGCGMLLAAAFSVVGAWTSDTDTVLFTLMDEIPIKIRIDEISTLFITITAIIWTAVTFYSFKYIKHEGAEKRFYGFFLLVYAVLMAIDTAGNLITFYFFYELMTLTSLPLVFHSRKRDAIMAGLKYLFYSMAGAYMALFGIFVLNKYFSLDFSNGVVSQLATEGDKTIALIAVFMMLIGFGVKAGMFPLHAWLPTAHPAAPAPASAALSAIIVKAGVLGIVRVVFYVVGADFIRGTWVQQSWQILTLITVFMGSMLAYREKVFKKRLAYSTVSQVSYILFGLSLLNVWGFEGAMFQLVAHALAKCALFMTAGIFILRTGKTRVDDYAGIGRTMKYTLLGYTLASLSLIGIPPTAGFVSKWYLAEGSLDTTGVISYLGPIILLVSALLTAGYLLPITMKGFFPGNECEVKESKEKPDLMMVFMVIIAVLALALGILASPLLRDLKTLAEKVIIGGLG